MHRHGGDVFYHGYTGAGKWLWTHDRKRYDPDSDGDGNLYHWPVRGDFSDLQQQFSGKKKKKRVRSVPDSRHGEKASGEDPLFWESVSVGGIAWNRYSARCVAVPPAVSGADEADRTERNNWFCVQCKSRGKYDAAVRPDFCDQFSLKPSPDPRLTAGRTAARRRAGWAGTENEAFDGGSWIHASWCWLLSGSDQPILDGRTW